MGRKLFKHQESGVKFLLRKERCILGDDMGLGKMLRPDEPVLTPKGWIRIDGLKINDVICDTNGETQTITNIFKHRNRKMYKITFTDKTNVICCEDHLWTISTPCRKLRNSSSLTLSTKELLDRPLQYKNKNTKYFIPITKPVYFEDKDILIDPYLLGLLLGDGYIKSGVKITTSDKEIVDYCSNISKDYNCILKQVESGGLDYRFTTKTLGHGNNLVGHLKHYGLFGKGSKNKFIPNDYLFNDINVRLSILQGLLDSDGYCGKGGTIRYCSISEQLKNGVKFLVNSLGGICRENINIAPKYTYKGEIRFGQDAYILTINFPDNIYLFRLLRKKERMIKVKKYKPYRGIKSIEYVGVEDGVCISVSSVNKQYIIHDFIVTHNTTTAITAALLSGSMKILVVCPANAKINWFREISYFINEEFITIVKPGFWQPKMFTIINYDILDRFHTLIDKRKNEEGKSYINEEKFDLMILDESHMLKHRETKRSKIINQISENIPKIWQLTGTPITSRPMDFYNLLSICKATVVQNWQHFAYRYCDAKSFKKKLKSGFVKRIWITDGASNLDELRIKTKPHILRRMKEDHLDLPPKIVSPFYLELENRVGYNKVFDEYLDWLKLEGRTLGTARQIVELVVLRKFISNEKVPYTLDMVNNFLEQSTTRKIIIFTVFTDSLNQLKQNLGDIAVCHNGKMNEKDRQLSIDRFQNDPSVRVFIGNIISAGSAINLTSSDSTIFHDLSFVPAEHDQAESRNHRIGTENTVNIYYPIFQDTVEEKIYEILEKKKNIISQVMGEENNTIDILPEIINYIFIKKEPIKPHLR